MINKKIDLVLIGGGGHSKVVIDAVHQAGKFRIRGIVDPKLKKGAELLGVPVLGSDKILKNLYAQGIKNAFIAVGSVGDCTARIKIFNQLKEIGFSMPIIIHPSAVVSSYCSIEDGVFIAAGVKINPDVKIERNAIINTSSSIDHDCNIGNFVHIAPGAVLSGGVKIGDNSHIGAGSVINQYIKVGKNCLVGSGSVVVKDIKDNSKAFGNPCKIKE